MACTLHPMEGLCHMLDITYQVAQDAFAAADITTAFMPVDGLGTLQASGLHRDWVSTPPASIQAKTPSNMYAAG